ncbi:hypothetical protein HY492_02290 [Candidatus Woesearchaeota archaeon]|nr:hypothetical protein [Candidatus Woesearchaeota archaeon]
MAEYDDVMNIARRYGFEEGIDLSTSKIEVRDWVVVKTKHQKGFDKCNALPIDQTKNLLQNDYTKAVILIGKEGDIVSKLIDVEKEVSALFPKAFVLIAGAQTLRPSLEASGIDALGTLRKFKKNVETLPEMGILLLD